MTKTNGFAKMDESFGWHVKYFIYNSIFSRKFLVFGVVCGLVLGRIVDQDIWMFTAFAYMGANVLEKYVATKEKEIEKAKVLTEMYIAAKEKEIGESKVLDKGMRG